MLFVEDIESMCRGTENRNTEGDDKASDDGLYQVERSGVDLHCKVSSFPSSSVWWY